eukprot:1988773-Rhodomonas_salina.5
MLRATDIHSTWLIGSMLGSSVVGCTTTCANRSEPSEAAPTPNTDGEWNTLYFMTPEPSIITCGLGPRILNSEGSVGWSSRRRFFSRATSSVGAVAHVCSTCRRLSAPASTALGAAPLCEAALSLASLFAGGCSSEGGARRARRKSSDTDLDTRDTLATGIQSKVRTNLPSSSCLPSKNKTFTSCSPARGGSRHSLASSRRSKAADNTQSGIDAAEQSAQPTFADPDVEDLGVKVEALLPAAEHDVPDARADASLEALGRQPHHAGLHPPSPRHRLPALLPPHHTHQAPAPFIHLPRVHCVPRQVLLGPLQGPHRLQPPRTFSCGLGYCGLAYCLAVPTAI